MAVTVDASSPIRWTGVPAGATSITSASFTAPANSLLVVCLSSDGTAVQMGGGQPPILDSGGLSWTFRVERNWAEATDGGASHIWTAPQVVSAPRTVSITNPAGNSARRFSAKLYVLTGVDLSGTPVDSVNGDNEGGSSTNDLTTTSITPGASGLLICCDTEWNQLGNITSSDLTLDIDDYTGEISVASGYKACVSGVGVTGNLNAAGTGISDAQHKWVQIIVRAAPSVSLGGNTRFKSLIAVAADDPMEKDHPFNKDRVGWWNNFPGLPFGGIRVLNLCDSRRITDGIISNITPTEKGPQFQIFQQRPCWNTNLPLTPYIQCAVDDTFTQPTVAGSLAIWAHPVETADYRSLIGYSDLFNDQNGATLFRHPSGDYALQLANGAGADNLYTTLTSTQDKWIRIGGCWDGNIMRVYQNGKQVIQFSTTRAATAGLNPTRIAGVAGYGFYGFLQDGCIWKRCLSPAEWQLDFEISSRDYKVYDSPVKWVSTRSYFYQTEGGSVNRCSLRYVS